MKPPSSQQAGHARPDGAAPLQHKMVDCEFKSIEDDGSFQAYFAVFGNVDRDGDVIEKGSFVNLDEFVRDGWIALNHKNEKLPVGYPTAAIQDDRGLLVSGKFHSVEHAQECRTIIKERRSAGKAVKCSIGYRVVDARIEQRDDKMVRVITALMVWEGSFVNLPANPAAEVVTVKSAGKGGIMANDSSNSNHDSNAWKALEALKAWLTGSAVQTKGGAAISKQNREAIKSFAASMQEHHEKGMDGCKCMMKACKAMIEHHEEGKAIGDDLHKFASKFEPVDEGDDDAEEKPPKPKKPKKKDDEGSDDGDTDDASPPKGKSLSRDQQAMQAYRDQLNVRALVGRARRSCP